MSEQIDSPIERRNFLRTACWYASLGGALISANSLCRTSNASLDAGKRKRPPVENVVGITIGGGVGRQEMRGELKLHDVPKYVSNELGMRLIDLNTRWFKSYELSYLDRLRNASEKAGCFFTNLKVNHDFGDLYSADSMERAAALLSAQHLIDSANRLGARWIRFPVPKRAASNPTSHRSLARYAEQYRMQLLIENGGWMKQLPNSVASTVKAIGRNVAACPDTGNWADEARMAGLRSAFQNAASCDFKVYELDKERRHARYDLKRCFDLGWAAGFRGPWVIEHMKPDTKGFARDTVFIRDMLSSWIRDAKS